MESYLIKGGTIVDGTLAPAYSADVRVKDGKIAEIGTALPENDETVVNAQGCLVTPGFIESHTHFDATMWWQNDLDPLPGYGATTMVIGNCGFSAAPVPDSQAVRDEIIGIFAFFEDIAKEPFTKELPWDWNKWSDYKRSMTAKVKLPLNYAAFVGHIAIRLAVMGLDGWTRAATAEEVERMAELLDDALAAGALGLSTNLLDHDAEDRPIPTLLADDAEFRALFAVLDRYPGTVFQVITDVFVRMTGPASVERLARLLEGTNVRMQWAGIPTLDYQKPMYAPMKVLHQRFREEGRDFWVAYAHVSPTITLGLTKSLVFAQTNDFVWNEVVEAPTNEEKLRLLTDPDWRARARDSWDNKALKWAPMNRPEQLTLKDSENGVGPIDLTLAEYMAQSGIAHRSDAMADWIARNGVNSTVHMAPAEKDMAAMVELLRDPKSMGNASDAGAHTQMMCGGGTNMLLISDYVDKGLITIEEAIHVMTGKIAEHFNLADRGVLAVGRPADIAVFDPKEAKCREERKIYDVPDGKGGTTWRYTRDAAPMRLTLVNGVATFARGGPTGAAPGAFLVPANEAFHHAPEATA